MRIPLIIILILLSNSLAWQTSFAQSSSQTAPCVKNEKGEQCLNKAAPYVKVPSKTEAPIILDQEPKQLKPRLPVEVVTYDQLMQGSLTPKKHKHKHYHHKP